MGQLGLGRVGATARVGAHKIMLDEPALPDLGALTAVGSRVFLVGGGDCGSFPNTERYQVFSDRHGGNPGIGRRVLILDLTKLSNGWVRGPDLPGTPRMSHALLTVNQSIYVLGGEAPENSTTYQPELLPPKHKCPNVTRCRADTLDSWSLDVTTMTWSRLPSNPYMSVGAMPSAIVWRNRWLIMAGVGTVRIRHALRSNAR